MATNYDYFSDVICLCNTSLYLFFFSKFSIKYDTKFDVSEKID